MHIKRNFKLVFPPRPSNEFFTVKEFFPVQVSHRISLQKPQDKTQIPGTMLILVLTLVCEYIW